MIASKVIQFFIELISPIRPISLISRRFEECEKCMAAVE